MNRGHTVSPVGHEPYNVAKHDAVVGAARFARSDIAAIVSAVKRAQVPRLLIVGGAASLEVAPGELLLDTPEFPEAYKAEARAGLRVLETLRATADLDWTILSPSAELVSGARTGSFRFGKDELLVDANGRSWITLEDFAVAFVDELEHPRHSCERFTVGY
jgi:uncharacterized protein